MVHLSENCHLSMSDIDYRSVKDIPLSKLFSFVMESSVWSETAFVAAVNNINVDIKTQL